MTDRHEHHERGGASAETAVLARVQAQIGSLVGHRDAVDGVSITRTGEVGTRSPEGEVVRFFRLGDEDPRIVS